MTRKGKPGEGLGCLGFLLALLALQALNGCAPLPAAPAEGPGLTERVGLEASARERAYLDLAERVYRARFRGGPLPVAGLVLHPAETLWDGPQRLAGWCSAWGVIHLPSRGRYPLRAILHELHHVAIGDPGHRRASWRTVDALGWRLAFQERGVGW